MAGRPRKQGLEFSGWSVDVFEDPKIERLMDAQGVQSFVIYFYLCQRAYAQYGYYLPWSEEDAVIVARRLGGGVRSSTVREIVGQCLRIGLFDKGLYDRCGILTSKALQRGFAVVLPKRRVKDVVDDYWLLPEEESGGAIRIPPNEANC